jgi:Spy/CpxP family protein refolding chaperone
MMLPSVRIAAVGMLLLGAAPLLAQSAPSPAPGAAAPGPRQGRQNWGMFAGLSEAGRATMREAMQAGGDARGDRAAVKAARDRMLVLLDADTLDVPALKRAMEEERRAAQASHDRRQSAMLAGFTKLSAADRKAFVANARQMQARMEARMGRWSRRGPGGPGMSATNM